jgi:membrane protease YdiL (CAAX protease family)
LTRRGLAWLALDDAGAPRAPWRLLFFAAAAVAAMIAVDWTVYPLVSGAAWFVARWQPVLHPWLLLLALLLAHATSIRVLRRESWTSVGLHREAARPAHFARGLLVGAAAVGAPSLVLVSIGWLRPEAAGPGSSLAAALHHLVFLAPAALAEELLVRAYPFAVLRAAAGDGVALVATSAVFGLLHLQNAGANLQSVLQVAFAGVWLGGVLLVTGSLYAAWAAHFGWNWVMAALLHTPVSGLRLTAPDYRLTDAGPDWATGGAWGPEAGLGATLGMAATLIYLVARHPRREEHRA